MLLEFQKINLNEFLNVKKSDDTSYSYNFSEQSLVSKF